MVSVDIYLNETTRHADVILPPPVSLQRGHYDVLLLQFAVRNVANYSPPVLPLDEGQPDEWEILAKLGMIAQGLGADADPAFADDLSIAGLIRCAAWSATRHRRSTAATPTRSQALLDASGRRGPERMLDFMLRTGPYGDGLRGEPRRAHPRRPPGEPARRRPRSSRAACARGAAHAERSDRTRTARTSWPTSIGCVQAMADMAAQPLVLVGRRHLRSNNSWMHNIEVLVKGAPRCTLQVHPDDACHAGFGRRRRTPG
jgi:anaerobic selenocysteine-containing dehydrogenase